GGPTCIRGQEAASDPLQEVDAMKIEPTRGHRVSARRWGRLVLLVAMLCMVLVSLGRMRVEAQAGTGGQGGSGLTVIEVKPHLYMITGAGSNVAVHIGRDGVFVKDTGTAEKADLLLAEIK